MPPSHKKSRGKQKRVGAPAFPANHHVAGAAAAAWAPLAASNVGPCLRSLTGPAFCWLQRLATCSTIDIVGPGRVTREELATGNLVGYTVCKKPPAHRVLLAVWLVRHVPALRQTYGP